MHVQKGINLPICIRETALQFFTYLYMLYTVYLAASMSQPGAQFDPLGHHCALTSQSHWLETLAHSEKPGEASLQKMPRTAEVKQPRVARLSRFHPNLRVKERPWIYDDLWITSTSKTRYLGGNCSVPRLLSWAFCRATTSSVSQSLAGSQAPEAGLCKLGGLMTHALLA